MSSLTSEAAAILGDLVTVTTAVVVDLPALHWPPPKPLTVTGDRS